MTKKITTIIASILALSVCFSGVVITRNTADRLLHSTSRSIENHPAYIGISPSLCKHMTFGFSTLVADFLFIHILTSYPLPAGREASLIKNNPVISITGKELSAELKSRYQLSDGDSAAGPPAEQHEEEECTTGDHDGHNHEPGHSGHDHDGPAGRLIRKIGFCYQNELEHPDNKTYTPGEIEKIYYLYDCLTSIDPHFLAAYSYGFSFFSLALNRPDLGQKLLTRGLKYNRSNPLIYQLLASNAVIFDQDRDTVRNYLLQGQKHVAPHYREFLLRLALTLEKSGNPYYIKMFFLNQIYHNEQNVSVKKYLEPLLADLAVKSTLFLMNRAVELYRSAYGRYPSSIDDILSASLFDERSAATMKMHRNNFVYDEQNHSFTYVVTRQGG